jgi:hypothetical protein
MLETSIRVTDGPPRCAGRSTQTSCRWPLVLVRSATSPVAAMEIYVSTGVPLLLGVIAGHDR